MWSASTELDDATAAKAFDAHGPATLSRWRSRRAKFLAAALVLGALWLWLGSGGGSLVPAAHHFVSVNGTQVR